MINEYTIFVCWFEQQRDMQRNKQPKPKLVHQMVRWWWMIIITNLSPPGSMKYSKAHSQMKQGVCVVKGWVNTQVNGLCMNTMKSMVYVWSKMAWCFTFQGEKSAVIYSALRTGSMPKCWSTSPSTLYRCSLTTTAQYYTINHFNHNRNFAAKERLPYTFHIWPSQPGSAPQVLYGVQWDN